MGFGNYDIVEHKFGFIKLRNCLNLVAKLKSGVLSKLIPGCKHAL